MKILETQSAILTNAEALVHIRNVHQQSLRNPEYSNRKGAKLRPLKTVIEEVNRNFQETGLASTPLPADTDIQARTVAPYPRAPTIIHPTTAKNPSPNKPQPRTQAYGDERIPLEATLDLKPAEAVPLPRLPRGPLMQRYDATEALLPPRASRRPDGSVPEDIAAAQRLWDPNPPLYAAPLLTHERVGVEGLAWLGDVVRALDAATAAVGAGGSGGGRVRLTKGEKVMVCNLRPRSAFELEYIVEEAEERLGGAEGVEALAGVLEGIWDRVDGASVAADGQDDVGMSG